MKKPKLTEAAAGPLGDDVRSDAHVAYRPGPAPLEIVVASKVDYLYGAAISTAARRAAEAFAVASGRLEVNDQGALEWVLLARLEACLRRAGFSGSPLLPEPAPGADAPRQRERLRRSRLYIPGNRPKLMLSAGLYGADGLILDLEDSVPPAAKDEARLLVRNALLALDWGSSERMVRINQGAAGDEDLAAIAPCNPHLLLLPKVEGPERVREVAARLRELLGGPEIPFLMPILESPGGVFRAVEIAAADPSVVALTLGLEDLSAELGAPRSTDGWESFLARQTTVYAARAAGVQPIASVYSDIRDEQGLTEYVRRERGLGAVAVGSKMVDPPVVRQAFRTVELAIAGGVLTADWEAEG